MSIFFLNALWGECKDPTTKQFIESIFPPKEYLGYEHKNKVKNFRLQYPQTKNTVFPTFDEILNHPYFAVYNKPQFVRPKIKPKTVKVYNRNTLIALNPGLKGKINLTGVKPSLT